jgi:hypothetical protein
MHVLYLGTLCLAASLYTYTINPMSTNILQRIEQRRLARKAFAPNKPPRIWAANSEDGGGVKPLAELPPPATPEDVADIAALYETSKAYMDSAKTKLQSRESVAAILKD